MDNANEKVFIFAINDSNRKILLSLFRNWYAEMEGVEIMRNYNDKN